VTSKNWYNVVAQGRNALSGIVST